jgi:hypothetical protein
LLSLPPAQDANVMSQVAGCPDESFDQLRK